MVIQQSRDYKNWEKLIIDCLQKAELDLKFLLDIEIITIFPYLYAISAKGNLKKSNVNVLRIEFDNLHSSLQ